MDYLTNPIPFPNSLPLIGVAGIAEKSGQSCFVPFRESRVISPHVCRMLFFALVQDIRALFTARMFWF